MSITKIIKECANRNFAKASKLFESELEKKVCEILSNEKEEILALDELDAEPSKEPVAEADEEEVKVEAEGDDEELKTESEDEEVKEEACASDDMKAESEDEDELKTESEDEEEVKTESEDEEVKEESDKTELDYVAEDDFEKIAESVLFGKRK